MLHVEIFLVVFREINSSVYLFKPSSGVEIVIHGMVKKRNETWNVN